MYLNARQLVCRRPLSTNLPQSLCRVKSSYGIMGYYVDLIFSDKQVITLRLGYLRCVNSDRGTDALRVTTFCCC